MTSERKLPLFPNGNIDEMLKTLAGTATYTQGIFAASSGPRLNVDHALQPGHFFAQLADHLCGGIFVDNGLVGNMKLQKKR